MLDFFTQEYDIIFYLLKLLLCLSEMFYNIPHEILDIFIKVMVKPSGILLQYFS